jgi:cation diffusion facilitator family transporter
MRAQVIIVATLVLNAGLFIANLSVALLSGSRTVLAQAIYTVTDLAGSALLLWGVYAARRPADYLYPFGRGKERFFWAFVSILITFTAAGLVALVTGIGQWVSPAPIHHIADGLLVIGASLAVSIGGIWITLRELRVSRQTLQALLESANQGLKSIFYQDLVTIAGCIVAFFGLLVVDRTGLYWIDGFTASIEGILLVGTGFLLTAESREYLIGRALDQKVARALRTVIEQDPRVARVRSLQSMLLGPEDALLALRINFRDNLTTDQIEHAIDEVTSSLKASYPVLRHIVIEPES